MMLIEYNIIDEEADVRVLLTHTSTRVFKTCSELIEQTFAGDIRQKVTIPFLDGFESVSRTYTLKEGDIQMELDPLFGLDIRGSDKVITHKLINALKINKSFCER